MIWDWIKRILLSTREPQYLLPSDEPSEAGHASDSDVNPDSAHLNVKVKGPRIAAAIDFGTHATGFAWALFADLDKDPSSASIQSYDTWPGTRISYPKNLTALLFDGRNVAYWGYEAKRKWAEAAAKDHSAELSYVSGFKMALKPSQYADSLPRGQGRMQVKGPEDARPLITEYLRRVRTVALGQIERARYDENDVRWCITIPAIWDEPDKDLMVKAAVAAGFTSDRLMLAREPEAAALQCQVSMADLAVTETADPSDGLGVEGSRFVIVDCGGGTVDITAYRVLRTVDGVQQLAEICRASGGKFGSEYLNRAFIERGLIKYLGPGVVEKLEQIFPQDMLELVDQWEGQKVNVRARLDAGLSRLQVSDPIVLNVPGAIIDFMRQQPGQEGFGYRLIIEPSDVQLIFDHVVNAILKEISDRLMEVRNNAGPSRGPETLLLVGGFANSNYLQKSIELRFGPDVRLIVPAHPAAAVMYGAVRICHRPDLISSRRTRYTYGYGVARPIENATDLEHETTRDDDGELLCYRFNSFVRIGASVSVGDTVQQEVIPIHRSSRNFGISLLASVEYNPRYPSDVGVQKIGSLTVDISESIGQDSAKRNVLLKFYFGDTRLRVEALNPRTKTAVETTIEFDCG
jgi:hypothetical protein